MIFSVADPGRGRLRTLYNITHIFIIHGRLIIYAGERSLPVVFVFHGNCTEMGRDREDERQPHPSPCRSCRNDAGGRDDITVALIEGSQIDFVAKCTLKKYQDISR
jgi:hypothetical protein